LGVANILDTFLLVHISKSRLVDKTYIYTFLISISKLNLNLLSILSIGFSHRYL